MTNHMPRLDEIDAAEDWLQAQRDAALIARAKRAGLELRWCDCADAWLLCGPAWRICTWQRTEVMAAIRLQERHKDRFKTDSRPKHHSLFLLFERPL